MKKQTAGRTVLGDFAPKFAELNDDVLFGQVWAREEQLSVKNRCMITVAGLIGKGCLDDSFRYHLVNAKNNGVTKEEMAEMITHLAFYCGWPNAWAAFYMAKEVYAEDVPPKHGGLFGLGEPNIAFAKYFTGKSYLKPLTVPGKSNVSIANVTFEPGCRNFWHIHKAVKGGGQILLCTEGEGWYQEEGKAARSLMPGDVIIIDANKKHWHGAKKDHWFSHLAVEVPGEETENLWCEPVSEEEYNRLC